LFINLSPIFAETERFKYLKNLFSVMTKRGQLGIIEFQYFMVGLLIGVFLALLLVLLGTKGVIGFKVPLVCG